MVSGTTLKMSPLNLSVCRGRGGYEQRVALVWLESFEDALTFPAQVITYYSLL
jgi:hypothetical protein